MTETRTCVDLDRLSPKARRRLRSVERAQESMEAAHTAMSRLHSIPRAEAVKAMLEAAYREASEGFLEILDGDEARAQAAAADWAREALDDPATVVLDSETTGLYGAVDFLEWRW